MMNKNRLKIKSKDHLSTKCLDSYLEMLIVERGAAQNTIESYIRDIKKLYDFAKKNKIQQLNITRDDIKEFIKSINDSPEQSI